MSIEITSFEQVSSELDNVLSDLSVIAAKVPDLNAAMSELATIRDNLTVRQQAVENRLTTRETTHNTLVNQLSNILGQMQVKLKGALELKSEIMPYDNALAAGYHDETLNIKIRADATAQRKFTSQLLIVRTAVEYAGAPSDMPIRIWDYEGKVHQVPFPQYIGLMLRFGQWVAAVEAQF